MKLSNLANLQVL